jgi:hypothetical protein
MRRCHQQGFFLAGELALRPRTRILAQGGAEFAGLRRECLIEGAGRVGRQISELGPCQLVGDPWQDIEAGQSLPAGPVRAGGLGRVGQDDGLGPLRAQSLDRKPPRNGCTTMVEPQLSGVPSL